MHCFRIENTFKHLKVWMFSGKFSGQLGQISRQLAHHLFVQTQKHMPPFLGGSNQLTLG